VTHDRPPGTSDATVEAVGRLTEALEYAIRARGHLYSTHQLVGRADLLAGEAADVLEQAGHTELAERVRTDLVGRNVLPGRWTFQVVEEFDATWWEPLEAIEHEVRDALLDGRRHVYESEMKDDRRTPGRPGHERRPGTR
jgi:hypothetical protein